MTTMSYAIAFVSDMDASVRFYRDRVGLPLKFQSPEWTEFATGPTTLALHRASEAHPAGEVRLGFTVPDVQAFHQRLAAEDVTFTQPPRVREREGIVLAEFLDPDGAPCSVSGETKRE